MPAGDRAGVAAHRLPSPRGSALDGVRIARHASRAHGKSSHANNRQPRARFLAQKKIAVVGVSEKREAGCNLGYRKFKEAGYTMYAVNPYVTTFVGGAVLPRSPVHS
jgi:hypothetical protein